MISYQKNSNKKIIIVLASYNGEKFIAEQLQSIVEQSYKYWVCYIYDDCSIDLTVNICRKFQLLYPDKFIIIQRTTASGSACRNFSLAYNELSKNDDYDYMAFCDQDDVWDKDKLSKMVNILDKCVEPSLVFSDLNIVDENLNVLQRSFINEISIIKNQHLNEHYLKVDNIVPGCSMMFNRELISKISEIPDDVLMHDWWMVICASKYKSIHYIEESLVSYRQHDKNSVGIRKKKLREYLIEYKKHLIKPISIFRMLKRDNSINLFYFTFLYLKIFVIKVFKSF